jgi:hypothetical protein
VIYRILTGSISEFWSAAAQETIRFESPLLGAGSTLGGVMWALHLPAPDFDNPRARFWFTEAGWDKVGREVVAEGRRRGYVIKVIRRKNPRRSQIVYRDAWQVALLPLRADGKGR